MFFILLFHEFIQIYYFTKSLCGLPSGDLFVSKSRSHLIPPLWKIGNENATSYASMVN